MKFHVKAGEEKGKIISSSLFDTQWLLPYALHREMGRGPAQTTQI